MNSAILINTIYILPLSKAFGLKNLSTAPFYFLRDTLYKIGWNLLPENDAEREMFWFAIRYKEFDELFMSDLGKYRKGKNKSDPAIFNNWTLEIYSHLIALATKPIHDDFFYKKRLEIFNIVANWYVICREAYINTRDIDTQKWSFIHNNDEIQKLKTLFNLFLSLKKRYHKDKTMPYQQLSQSTNHKDCVDPKTIELNTRQPQRGRSQSSVQGARIQGWLGW